MGSTCGAARRGAVGRIVSGLGAVALAVGLAACTSPDSSPTPSPTTGTTEPGTTTPSAPAEETVERAVYYVVDTRAGVRLARETRELDAADRGVGAVETMIAGAEDPDYATTWNPQTSVLSVEMGPEVITVDLSEEARTANVGSEGAALMIQQLVWTVTSALDATGSPVVLLVEGEPAGELWGAVTWDRPVMREDDLDVRVLVQIDVPTEGAEVTSPVEVSGEAAAFEANVPWRVLDAEGGVVESGFTMTSEGQTFAPFSFTVELAPGTYTVEISEDDPSDGEAGTPMTDTRTIVVS